VKPSVPFDLLAELFIDRFDTDVVDGTSLNRLHDSLRPDADATGAFTCCCGARRAATARTRRGASIASWSCNCATKRPKRAFNILRQDDASRWPNIAALTCSRLP